MKFHLIIIITVIVIVIIIILLVIEILPRKSSLKLGSILKRHCRGNFLFHFALEGWGWWLGNSEIQLTFYLRFLLMRARISSRSRTVRFQVKSPMKDSKRVTIKFYRDFVRGKLKSLNEPVRFFQVVLKFNVVLANINKEIIHV